MLYFIKKLNLPADISKLIYEYVDNFYEIRNLKKIWYKRLITSDYYYFSKLYYTRGIKPKKYSLVYLCLEKEEEKLKILLKNKVYDMIENIHMYNLKKYNKLA